MVRKSNFPYTRTFDLDDMDRQKYSLHSVPFWIGLILILVLCGLFGIVFLIDSILPSALTVNDEINYPDSFIAERAANDLKYLTDFGPRITGGYKNEYLVIEFLSTKINQIIADADSSQYVEWDIQKATGGYFLNNAVGYMNVYNRVQNVVVKLHGKNNDSEHGILINSHFDSVPSSPGGTDDGINVVAMLEILRKLSKSNERQLHNVIFLFNGAEETPRQASHGFITHHKWANESKYLINLDASGSEGKITLFQTEFDTPWLIKYYAKVPRPYGSVMAEEIFKSGIIPSNTDFRIFVDFGNLVGFDMAFFRNGFRYHTKYDGFSNIPMGSYQHVGDNTLSLVKSLANAPEVLVSETERTDAKPVYYDVFSWFMISYDARNARIINLVTIGLSFAVFLFSLFTFKAGMTSSTFKYILLTMLAILFSWILAGVFVIGLCKILDILNKTMSWYANPWLIFGLYIVPIFGISGSLLFFTNIKILSLGIRGQIQAHLVRIIWTLVLILGLVFNIRSTFLLTILIMFNTAGFIVIHLFGLQHTIRTWQIIYLISQLIPTIQIMYQFLVAIFCFVPVTGRISADINPELYIGIMTLGFVLLLASPFTVLTNFLRRARWYFLALLAMFIVFFGIIFTPVGFPYSANPDAPKPQRHWITHTTRLFHDEKGLIKKDSGFFMLNMDRNSPKILKPYLKEIMSAESLEEDCLNYTLCALPLIHAKSLKNIKYSTWIPASAPEFPANETLNFTVVSKQQLSPTQIKYNVQVSGPDRLAFYLTPKTNAQFIGTSLMDTVKPTVMTFQDRPIYVILYQLGKGDGSPFTFDFTMEVSEGHTGPTLDFAVSGRYVHPDKMQKTPAYLEFLNQFPDWADAIPLLAAHQTYTI